MGKGHSEEPQPMYKKDLLIIQRQLHIKKLQSSSQPPQQNLTITEQPQCNGQMQGEIWHQNPQQRQRSTCLG